MREILTAIALLASCGAVAAAPLTTTQCSSFAAEVDRGPMSNTVEILPLLARDGDVEVAAAARRLADIYTAAGTPAALTNASQDLRYQLQVCARR